MIVIGKRWTPNRKIEIVKAIREGVLTTEGAIEKHKLSVEELSSWISLYDAHGANGLRVTRMKQYRGAA